MLLLSFTVSLPLTAQAFVSARQQVPSQANQYVRASAQVFSFRFDNTPLPQALKRVADQAGLGLSYNSKLISEDHWVSVDLREATIPEVLDHLLAGTEVTADVSPDRVIRLRRRVSQSVDQEVRGRVIDASTQQPLPGVNIQIPNTIIGTSTDIDGQFQLTVADSVDYLIFSYIGYETVEQPINNASFLEVALTASTNTLDDEVVVVGYGTQRRSDLTGAISSVDGQLIEEMPVASFDQALRGRSAGVQVTQTSHTPGGGVSIRVRGGNSITAGNEPLFVIDGVPVFDVNQQGGSWNSQQPLNVLSTINPNDIASIEILKDASATAIYGARAANGVVLVTTKRGTSGQGKITASAYYGVQEVSNPLEMLNARQFAELTNEAFTAADRDPVFNPDTLTSNTDWQDALFQVAPIQNYQISFSGGNQGNYYLSANLFQQDGVVKGSDFWRGSLRFNNDRPVTSRLTVGNSITLSRTASQRVATESGNSVVRRASRISPTLPVYDAFGDYTWGGQVGNGVSAESNPLFEAQAITSEKYLTRMLGSVYAEYQVANPLTLRIQLGTDLVFARDNYYEPREPRGNRTVSGQGFATVASNESRTFLNENTLTYANQWGDHALTVLGGFTVQAFRFEELRSIADQFATDELTYFNMASAIRNAYWPRQNYDRSAILSYLSRVNYNYQGKYLLTAAVRADGSSKFGDGNKWGLFPSVAAAWRLSDESFLSSASWLNDLKLRVSWGLTGNQNIPSYRSLGQVSEANYVFNEIKTIGQTLVNVANPNLQWETTNQTDIGIDAAFWSGRLSVTADYYYKRTSDLLYDVSLPRTTGFASSVQNIGSLENEGLELAITTVNVENSQIYWETSFNVARNRSEVLNLGQETERLIERVDGILRVGKPIGSFYGYQTDGIFQSVQEVEDGPQADAQPGDRRYVRS